MAMGRHRIKIRAGLRRFDRAVCGENFQDCLRVGQGFRFAAHGVRGWFVSRHRRTDALRVIQRVAVL